MSWRNIAVELGCAVDHGGGGVLPMMAGGERLTEDEPPNDPYPPRFDVGDGVDQGPRQAEVVGRWHDNRHPLVTAEAGAGDEVITSITGLVSRAILSRDSQVRMEAKRRALDDIAARQCAADENRRKRV